MKKVPFFVPVINSFILFNSWILKDLVTKPSGKEEWLYVSDQTFKFFPQNKSEANATEGADPNLSVSKSELEGVSR